MEAMIIAEAAVEAMAIAAELPTEGAAAQAEAEAAMAMMAVVRRHFFYIFHSIIFFFH